MRYSPGHKVEVHRKIVEDASQRVRSEGLSGAAVTAVMKDAGLTHGGFYKHFKGKDELILESLKAAFAGTIGRLTSATEHSAPGAEWKAIVKAYLSPEHCAHPELGCPLAALGPDLARVGKKMRPHISGELTKYKRQMLPFMPGRRAADKELAFFSIFSTMIGAVEMARLMPDPSLRDKVLANARDFLLRSF